MKKLLSIALVLTGVISSQAQTTVAQWTFNGLTLPNTPGQTPPTPTTGSFAPDTGTGSATGFHNSSAAVWSTPAGNGSVKSFSVNNWSVGDYFQFQTSTTGYDTVKISYDQIGSNTGPRDFKFAYSTDGSGFTDFGVGYSLIVASWTSGTPITTTSYSFDLSGVSALNDASTVFFRIIDTGTASINGGSVAAAGTGRIDNFTLTATALPVPEPTTFALIGCAGVGLLLRRRYIS